MRENKLRGRGLFGIKSDLSVLVLDACPLFSLRKNHPLTGMSSLRWKRIITNKLEIRERSHFVSKCPVVIPEGFDKRIEMKPRHKKRSCKFAGLSERAKWREFQSRNFLR